MPAKAMNKYRFSCECRPHKRIVISPDYFSSIRYLDLLGNVYWYLDQSGKIQLKNDRDWPPELSKSYFNSKAREFAKLFLKRQTKIDCDECGLDILVEKL